MATQLTPRLSNTEKMLSAIVAVCYTKAMRLGMKPKTCGCGICHPCGGSATHYAVYHYMNQWIGNSSYVFLEEPTYRASRDSANGMPAWIEFGNNVVHKLTITARCGAEEWLPR